MGLGFAHGAVQWLAADGVGSTYVVSGLAFQPKAIRLYWVGIASSTDASSSSVHQRSGVGFAADATNRRATAAFSEDAAANSNCGTAAANDCVALTVDGAGAIDGKLDIDSIASDGFTLIVDDAAPADLTVFWEAWGGTDITNVTVGDIAEPAATGTQNYTATGFVATPADPDQVVMLAGVYSSAALGSGAAAASAMCVGVATGSGASEQAVLASEAHDGAATSGTYGYARAGECLALINGSGSPAGVGARASLSAWGTDLFTLNWAERIVTNRRYIFLAIKGGRWAAGGLTVDLTTVGNTAAVSGLSFTPMGLSLLSRGTAESSADTATNPGRLSMGTASGTSARRTMSVIDRSGQATMDIWAAVEYDQILTSAISGGSDSVLDLSAIAADGFTLVVDGTGVLTNAWQGYLAFGSASGGGTTYNVTLAGSLTPTGALIRQTTTLLVGAITPGGVLYRVVSTTLAGVVTPTATVVRTVATQLAGTLAPVGALVRAVATTLAGTMAPAGTVVRTTAKVLAGDATPAAILSSLKVAVLAVAGSVAPTGALLRTISTQLTGGMLPDGAVGRRVATIVAGALAPAGDLARMMLKPFAGLMTPAGTLGTLKSAGVMLVGALAPSGGLVRRVTKVLSGVVSPMGALLTSAIIAAGNLLKLTAGIAIRPALSAAQRVRGPLAAAARMLARLRASPDIGPEA